MTFRAGWQVAFLYGVASIGGLLFQALSLPLPWVLGAMAAILVWRAAARRIPGAPSGEQQAPAWLKNAALFVLGTSFGLQFTRSTIEQVAPYLIPFLSVTVALVAVCIVFGIVFSRWSRIDSKSSVFGFIPGGLTEMVVTGEATGAKPGAIVFIQTIRLLTVLSVVPFAVTAVFGGEPGTAFVPLRPADEASGWAYLWFAIPAAAAWLLRRRIPAAFVLVPMVLTGAIHMGGVALPGIAGGWLIPAQLTIGLGLGQSVSFRDLQAMWKQTGRVLSFVAAMLLLSFIGGALLSRFTGMDLPTSLLSVAPGGLIEMALTAQSVGADPTIVTSLQFVRLYTILAIVPFVLKRWFAGEAESGGAT